VCVCVVCVYVYVCVCVCMCVCVYVCINATNVFLRNITLSNGAKIGGNSTCIILISPDASTRFSVCDQ